ncbi:type I toxin-antitoxin system toxin TisB, partial [Acinetobacter baumannii]|nr:type I toxin-antitoxin system toxin TisB [Acinetobacter baumannii]
LIVAALQLLDAVLKYLK